MTLYHRQLDREPDSETLPLSLEVAASMRPEGQATPSGTTHAWLSIAATSISINVLRGWLPLMMLPLMISVLTPIDWPAWALMWALAIAIYAGCKWLTWRRSKVRSINIGRQLGYLLLWPGMDADRFLNVDAVPVAPAVSEWLFAGIKCCLGLLTLYGVVGWLPVDDPYWVGWVGMIGLVLTLHFGIFHLLSCAWRAVGVDARRLMNGPLLAKNLSEFWGRRWNTAFRDLTHRYLFKPLVELLGPRIALLSGFVFSGLVHDVVISFPARGGYGGPTLYFMIQAFGMLTQRSAVAVGAGLAVGWRGWLLTLSVLMLPAPLLFHRPFVERLIVPFMQAIGVVG